MTRKGKVSSSSTFHIKLFGSVVVVLCRCRGRHHLRSNKGQRAESMRGAKKAKYSLLRPRDFVCSAEEKRREKGHSTRKPTTTNALWHVTCATRDLFHTTYYASESCNSSYETTDILSKTNDFNPHVCVCVCGGAAALLLCGRALFCYGGDRTPFNEGLILLLQQTTNNAFSCCRP